MIPDLDQIRADIEAITEQVNRLSLTREPRQPGDVDIVQLCKAWGMADSTVRRRMKLVGDHSEQTGFERLTVWDPDRKHDVVVLRKMRR